MRDAQREGEGGNRRSGVSFLSGAKPLPTAFPENTNHGLIPIHLADDLGIKERKERVEQPGHFLFVRSAFNSCSNRCSIKRG